MTEVASLTLLHDSPVERRSVLHRLEAVVVQVGSATRVVAGACVTSVVRALHVDGAIRAIERQKIEGTGKTRRRTLKIVKTTVRVIIFTHQSVLHSYFGLQALASQRQKRHWTNQNREEIQKRRSSVRLNFPPTPSQLTQLSSVEPSLLKQG